MTTPAPLDLPDADRTTLRGALRALRFAIPQRAERNAAIDSALLRVLHKLQPEVLGVYYPTHQEYDPLPVLRTLMAERPELRLALPVTQRHDHGMRFVAWAPDQPLHPGPHGIPEPHAHAPEVEPDTLLVPCLGFASVGLRLGYGGGYYDRYLATRGDVFTLGLAFEACRLEHLRAEPHDCLLDLILTESAGYGLEAEFLLGAGQDGV